MLDGSLGSEPNGFSRTSGYPSPSLSTGGDGWITPLTNLEVELASLFWTLKIMASASMRLAWAPEELFNAENGTPSASMNVACAPAVVFSTEKGAASASVDAGCVPSEVFNTEKGTASASMDVGSNPSEVFSTEKGTASASMAVGLVPSEVFRTEKGTASASMAVGRVPGEVFSTENRVSASPGPTGPVVKPTLKSAAKLFPARSLMAVVRVAENAWPEPNGWLGTNVAIVPVTSTWTAPGTGRFVL